jgi:hypothetical protein
MAVKITGDEIRFTSASGEVTTYVQEDAKQVFEKRKTADGMKVRKLRAMESASTYIDLGGTYRSQGDKIDIYVKDTFEALSVSAGRISLGPKETVPLELTGSLKIRPSHTTPHDFQGKYVFSGNPIGLSGGYTAGTGVEISGSLDVSGSYGNYSFESMSIDILQGGQLTYGTLGVLMAGNSNVTIEEAVMTQPGVISQSLNIGTSASPSINVMTGVGDNCYIKIAEGVVVRVLEGSTFKVQCPQPDVIADSDTGEVTISDPNVNGGGDIIIYNNNNGNPSVILQSTTIPVNQVSYWTVGNNIPGTYTSYTPGSGNVGIQIGGGTSTMYDGIYINGVEIHPSYDVPTANIKLRIEDGATLTIQSIQPDVTVEVDSNTVTLSDENNEEVIINTGTFGSNNQYITNIVSFPSGQVAHWYGPIYIGTTTTGEVTNIGSLRLNENAQIRIQAF